MAPRIPPKPVADLDPETAELITKTLRSPDGEPLNIFRTLSHHPVVLRRFMSLGTELLMKGSLPARERELLILRTGWNCQSEYEWGQHVAIGRAVGLTDVELARIKPGPDADGWSEGDAALLRAADELHAASIITGETWSQLEAAYPDPATQIEILMVIGYYHLVAFFLNTSGVEREVGVVGLDSP
ncbi:MAG TPA: carboxymuconolactone decarboxylase family protein [Acidimicrobiales bacterium]|nr:carboxymuconolactone decarboxylase family protein [Acidimicrobiales bacterium]